MFVSCIPVQEVSGGKDIENQLQVWGHLLSHFQAASLDCDVLESPFFNFSTFQLDLAQTQDTRKEIISFILMKDPPSSPNFSP